tara:strand:- start:932 stop:2509 length:1578 start_codon:yes stop_codon:yes gene_type:complete
MDKDKLLINKSILIFCLFGFSLIIRLNFGYSSSIWLDEAWRITEARSYEFETWLDIWKHSFSFEGLLNFNDNLFEGDLANYRIIFVVVSSLASPLSFILAQKLFDTKLSLVIGLLIALSSWHITYSNELAAYGVGTTMITLLCIVLFDNKETLLNTFLIASIAAFVGVLHLYLIGFTCLLLCSKYFVDFINLKNIRSLYVCFILICFVLLVNSGQIYIRFFDFSGTNAFDNKLGMGWILGFPILLANLILPGPLENRWIPTANEAGLIFMIIAVILGILVVWGAIKLALVQYYGIKNGADIDTDALTQKLLIISIFLPTIGYVSFIYVQAFFVHGAFTRYLLPALPLIVICIFSIFKRVYIFRFLSAFNIGVILLTLNIAVLVKGDFTTHFKNPYKEMFKEIGSICLDSTTSIIVPSFLEMAIAKFYLEGSSCELIIQPSFKDFFVNRNKALVWQTTAQLNDENEFLIKELALVAKKSEFIIFLGDRSKSRVKLLLSDPVLADFIKLRDSLTPLGMRTVIMERSR